MLFSVVASATLTANAEVNWRLQAGGMYQKTWDFQKFSDYGSESLDKCGDYNLGLGVFLQIPLGKTSPFFIETGLGWLYKPQLSVSEEFDFSSENFVNNYPRSKDYIDYGKVSILEIPVKFGYAYRLNKRSQLEFAVGPYISSAVRYEYGDTWGAGLVVSAAYRYRKMSYGISWENPVFYNGPRDQYRNTFQVTIGFNFGLGAMRRWNWDNILTGMEIVGGVMQSTANTMAAAGGSNSYDSYSGSSSSSSSSSSSRSSASSGKMSTSEYEAYKTDRRTYERYESQLASHYAGNQTMSAQSVQDAKKAMKRIREKWTKRGQNFTKSPYDTL